MAKITLLASLLLTGCFAHIPMHTTEHMNVRWRASYQEAQEEALAHRPPDRRRHDGGREERRHVHGRGLPALGGAARCARIARLNDEFVPVWINVRTTPVPAWPFVRDILVTAKIDKDGRVRDKWSRNYYVHTILVSPDGQTLLNPGASTVASTARSLVFEGDFSYSTIDPGDYLSMLSRAERRLHPEQATAS